MDIRYRQNFYKHIKPYKGKHEYESCQNKGTRLITVNQLNENKSKSISLKCSPTLYIMLYALTYCLTLFNTIL